MGKAMQRDSMEDNLNKWMDNTCDVIDDVTKSGNHFIVMKLSTIDLLSDTAISDVLHKVNYYIQELAGISII